MIRFLPPDPVSCIVGPPVSDTHVSLSFYFLHSIFFGEKGAHKANKMLLLFHNGQKQGVLYKQECFMDMEKQEERIRI